MNAGRPHEPPGAFDTGATIPERPDWEDVVLRFEQAWQSSVAPDLPEFVSAESHHSTSNSVE